MSLKVGIVGLPNAGKSTLFNALVTKPKAGVGQHPFTTIEKNIGLVTVPDSLLFELAKIENIAKVTPVTITFIDIAGLIKNAHQGEGLGNQFLHHIREVDLVLHLARFFEDKSIPHIHPKIDPEEDIEIIEQELILADLESLDKKLKKTKVDQKEQVFIKKIISQLDKGIPARNLSFNEEELNLIKKLSLLSFKTQIIVANIGEKDINKPAKQIKGKSVLSICAKLESDLSELPWVEQQQFLKTYGLKKSAKENIIKTCYQALDIISFYTIAKKNEAKAWTLKKDSSAIQAAEKVHTDFAKRFIKAEIINIDKLISIGSWEKALQQGAIGIKGKDYLIQNQDVVEFKVGGIKK